jgi:hypothetical protein
MAKKSIQRVKAIDVYTGSVVSVPKNDVTEVGVLPVGPDNMCIHASIRFFQRFGTYGTPKRLTGIRQKHRQFVMATWRDENGKRACCTIRHEGDARDSLFASLSSASHARLVAAAQNIMVRP